MKINSLSSEKIESRVHIWFRNHYILSILSDRVCLCTRHFVVASVVMVDDPSRNDNDLIIVQTSAKKKRRKVPKLDEELSDENSRGDRSSQSMIDGVGLAANTPAEYVVNDNIEGYDDGGEQVAVVGMSEGKIGPRRSSRVRHAPKRLTLSDESGRTKITPSNKFSRLEQINCITPLEWGLPEAHPSCRLRVIVHPVAMALISLHAHLTRTEVIGFLGGGIRRSESGDVDVLVAEAFPAQGICDRTMAATGRSAFAEVEIDPESSVEVMTRVTRKKLQVVGWYHSHPDASFSVEPSRVDIENQQNYQQFIYKDAPFVAAIIAPYTEDLLDHMPDFRFFHVHEREIPLKLPFTVGLLGANALEGYAFGDHCYPIDDFVAESMALVASYSQFAKRVRLDRDWRDGVDGVDKLRRALLDIGNNISGVVAPTDTEANHEDVQISNKKQYQDSVFYIMENVEKRWKESGIVDDEKSERNRQKASPRKKRSCWHN